MATTPIRFEDDNLKYLNTEGLKKGRREVTALVNKIVRNHRTSMLLDDFLDSVEHPKVFRLKGSSTTSETSRLCQLASSEMMKKLVLCAKKCDLNERTLSGYAEFENFSVVFDNTMINHAREPRIMEVEDLLRAIGSSQCNFSVGLITEVVDSTCEHPVEEAWEYLRQLPVTPFSISKFLQVIAPNQSHKNLLRYQPTDGYCVMIAEPAPYGRDKLVDIKRFELEEDGVAYYEKLLSGGKSDSSGKAFRITFSVYGRPERFDSVFDLEI